MLGALAGLVCDLWPPNERLTGFFSLLLSPRESGQVASVARGSTTDAEIKLQDAGAGIGSAVLVFTMMNSGFSASLPVDFLLDLLNWGALSPPRLLGL